MKTTRRHLFLFAVLLTWLLSSCGGQTATPAAAIQTATLSELQGSVEIMNPGQTEVTPAGDGMTITEGGQIQTGEDGRVRLDLSTGTMIRLAPNTSFLLASNAETEDGLFTRIQLAAGRIWIVLTGGSMDVETPSGVASVRGSYMSVWVDPETEDVWVTCLEGWCQAENPTSETW